MCIRKFTTQFVSGMAFPAIFMPLAYTMLYTIRGETLTEASMQFLAMYVPLSFGLTNSICISFSSASNMMLAIFGAVLGLIIASLGIFVLDIPAIVFNIKSNFEYFPLIIHPILFALIFRYIVKWFNDLLGV